jgi:hypothetical protein
MPSGLLYSEGKGKADVQNISNCTPSDMASHPRRPENSETLL